MSSYVDTNTRTFEVDEALNQFTRVKMGSDGDLDYADAGDIADGVAMTEVFAAGDLVAVKLRSGSGTCKVRAAGAITCGDWVYGAADGEVSGDCAGELFGRALEAATADNDIIEVLMIDPAGAFGATVDVGTVAAAGSSQSDATALVNLVSYVTAADGTKGVKLPAAVAGLTMHVYSTVATNGLKVYPNTDDDINDGTSNAAITIEGKTHAIFVAVDSTTWAAVYTANT